jgi:predicted amidohydrolase YtcJ
MRRCSRIVFLSLVLGVLRPAAAAEPGNRPGPARPEKRADTLFTNGNVYTGNPRQPRAQAIAVAGDRIVFVGSNQEGQAFSGPGARVVDLAGRTVVPGLADAHVHLAGVGQREMSLNLEGTQSLKEMLDRLAARVAQARPGAWVTGRGWIETFWTPPVFPTRWDLDKVSPRNPVYISRADGHGGVANSAALARAGITRGTASPFGGEIVKDPKTGEPSGMLVDAAQPLVTRKIPPPTPAEEAEALVVGARRMVALGWTQAQIAGNSWAEVELLRRLYREKKIKLRIYDAIRGPGRDADVLLDKGASVGELGGRLTVRTIKVSIDGALGSRGAALLAPYADGEGVGLLTQKEEVLRPLFEKALRRGIQLEVHAIGDRANRVILDLYQQAFAAVPPNQRAVAEPRWRVEHAQILRPDDVPRFAENKVIASMQPSHAISDLHFAPRRLGVARLEAAYAWRRLLASGATIAGGSDAPVERGEPLIELYAAVARKDLKGQSGEGWHPEQAVSRQQALDMFTRGAAYAAFEEDRRGTIEVGKLADLTVFASDVLAVPEAEILRSSCAMTIIGGEVVFEAKPPESAAGRPGR